MRVSRQLGSVVSFGVGAAARASSASFGSKHAAAVYARGEREHNKKAGGHMRWRNLDGAGGGGAWEGDRQSAFE